MKSTSRISVFLAVAAFCFTSNMVFAQQRTSILKAGFLRTTHPATPPYIAFEGSVAKSLSAQVGIAVGRRKAGFFTIGSGHFTTVQASFEGRYYFALRQEMSLVGFYSGLYAAYDWQKVSHVDYVKGYAIQNWPSVGIVLGFQQAFLKERFRIDGGIKWGYRHHISRIGYTPEGDIRYEDQLRLEYNYNAYFQIGYTIGVK